MNMRTKRQKFFSGIAFCILFLFLCALLNRCGSLILFWKEWPVGGMSHDAGYAYFAFLPDENIAKLHLPIFLKEDETFLDPGPLSVNEDRIALIKETGGAWEVLENNDLYFSASDGNPESHEYRFISPVIIRNRYLLMLAVLALGAAGLLVFPWLKRKDSAPLKTVIRWLAGAFFLMLLLPWEVLSYSTAPASIGGILVQPMLRRNFIFLCLLALLLLPTLFFTDKGRLFRILSIMVILVNTLWYFVPEWPYYGLRADSPAYLQPYSAASLRTPGYPVFISAVYSLSGNDGLESLRERGEFIPDERLLDGGTTDSEGLLTVIRAQKCVLAAAFLLCFVVWRRYHHPAWFVYAAQIILCGGFLGVDNSYIMTECLSQAVTLLLVAALLVTVKERKIWAFLLLCALAGIAVLIRPANIYLSLAVLVCAIFLLKVKRSLWAPLAGCLIFEALCAIPAITIYQAYHIFVWMPSSGYVEIARAVDIMQPGDVEVFENAEDRAFAEKLLEKKAALGEADQNTYMWEAAVAAAEEMGYDHINCSPLFSRVSRKIFLLHPRDVAAALKDSVSIALERTRLRLGRFHSRCCW